MKYNVPFEYISKTFIGNDWIDRKWLKSIIILRVDFKIYEKKWPQFSELILPDLGFLDYKYIAARDFKSIRYVKVV